MYLSTQEIAKKWKVSSIWVSMLCNQGRISGAVKEGKCWRIPSVAEKPADKRSLRKKPQETDSMLKTIDLFAGAGGLSLGFKQTGKYKILAAAEIQESARETYKKNIPETSDNFVFIDNVINYDFKKLNEELGGIDVVIGGPPCQGFSQANRQKNHLVSMNNALVKEFFRAIKEINPVAFVMENVSMLESSIHRFYDSRIDHDEIESLNERSDSLKVPIPFRKERIVLSTRQFDGINIIEVVSDEERRKSLLIPHQLYHLLHVLNKNKANERRLPNYLKQHTKQIIKMIDAFCSNSSSESLPENEVLKNWMLEIKEAIERKAEIDQIHALTTIIDFQKVLCTAGEIADNQLIGEYQIDENSLCFLVNSYAVIDYVNAILGNDYTQHGATLNAEWFGVPQERKRHIVIGVRNDYLKNDFSMPCEPEDHPCVTVWEAISDLEAYKAETEQSDKGIDYLEGEELSEYQKRMRNGSTSVKNHFTTDTTETALERFRKLEPGENFLSLPSDLKTTYSEPERTQKTIYYRLRKDKPSGTVVNVRKSMWIHPTLDRALSLREAARLQSFPDSFEFAGAKNSQYQQVGNAVPPMLAEAVANHLFHIIESQNTSSI